MTTANQAVTLAIPAQEFIPSLIALFNGLIRQRRTWYHAANQLIQRNLANGEPRQPCHRKPRLSLSLEKLTEHMQARDTRCHAQRELSLIVPLLRTMMVARQKKDSFDPATSPALTTLARALHLAARTPGDRPEDVEKHLATLVLTTYPFFFPVPADLGPAAALHNDDNTKDVKAREDKRQLFNKLTTAGILDGKEICVLRSIFWQ